MLNSSRLFIVFMLLGFTAVGCGGPRGRVDPSAGSPFVSIRDPKDIEQMTDQMARSLLRTRQIANAEEPPTIAFAEMRNLSDQPMDTDMLLEMIRTPLIRNSGGKMTFLDRARSVEVMRERELKRAGQVTTSGDKALLGADFFLTGDIRTITQTDGRTRYVHARYSFRLTDAESTQIIWEDDYTVTMVGGRSAWER